MARRLGAKDEWLAAIRKESPGGLDGMEDSWRTALRYAELVTESGHAVTDQDYAALAKHWDDGEIVEITQVIGLFNYFNRFNDALRVEVTK